MPGLRLKNRSLFLVVSTKPAGRNRQTIDYEALCFICCWLRAFCSGIGFVSLTASNMGAACHLLGRNDNERHQIGPIAAPHRGFGNQKFNIIAGGALFAVRADGSCRCTSVSMWR